MSHEKRPAILVFVRHPAFGPVKTRLAAALGPEEARRIYAILARDVWEGLAHPRLDRWLVVEPAAAVPEAGDWLRGARAVLGQPEGDLGQRLAWAFGQAFGRGAPAAAVVGTDAPEVDAARALEVLEGLAETGAAVIPSLDGGYALLALRRPAPGLFEGVAWSTPRVLAQTRERARTLGLEWREYPPVRDLDTLADLEALRAEGLWRDSG